MGAIINSTKKILITGSNGLLGQKIIKLCLENRLDYIATSLGANRNPSVQSSRYFSLDISDANAVEQLFSKIKPDCVINTAAITNVDLCESTPDDCDQINVDAVNYILNWCKTLNIHFIQISTDFVFDGKKSVYVENDLPNPLSIYGKSKLKAEKLIQNSSLLNWTIMRTSVVYGVAHNMTRSNIVLWARSEILRNRKINIVGDQYRAPTWAEDLATACLRAVEKEVFGVYNIVGPECVSILEFVKRMAKYYKQPEELVQEIKTNELNQVAERPLKTHLDISKAKQALGYNPLNLENTLSLLEKELPLYS